MKYFRSLWRAIDYFGLIVHKHDFTMVWPRRIFIIAGVGVWRSTFIADDGR